MPTFTGVVCAHCGETFDSTPGNPKQKHPNRFCSAACRGAASKRPRDFSPRPCELCRTVFDPTPARPVYPPRRFCSRDCMLEGRRRAQQRREQLRCQQCGAQFAIPRSHAQQRHKHRGKFCSRACCWQYWREHPEESPSARNRPDTVHDSQGYVWVTVSGRGRMRQHHIVMERVLGRALEPWETVHHKNGNRADNRPENLELWQGKQPAGVRSSDALAARLEALEQRVLALETDLAAVRGTT